MSFLYNFEVALRLDDLTVYVPSNSSSQEVWSMMWTDYTTRGRLFSEASDTLKDELVSYSLSYLHTTTTASNAFLAAVLFRLADFCQWCTNFEHKLLQRLDPQLFNSLIKSFEGSKVTQNSVLHYDKGKEAFNYGTLTAKDSPMSHRFSTGCYLYALDYLLSQLAHNVTTDMLLFSSICKTADRLTDVIINFRMVDIVLLEKVLPLIAKLMTNTTLYAFVVTVETFDHGVIDKTYMEKYAEDYYASRLDCVGAGSASDTVGAAGLAGTGNVDNVNASGPHKVFVGSKLLPQLISIIINNLPRVAKQQIVEFPLIYGCLLCIWMSSFVEKRALLTQGIFVLANQMLNLSMLQNVVKIVRTILKILLNISTLPEAVDFMVASQLETTLLVMEAKGWQESKENNSGSIGFLIRELHSILDQSIRKVTTWETYLAELKSDMLSNTPVHTSEAFWKANSHKLVENSAYALNRLAQIGTQAYNSDPGSLLVCLNDIGMFCVNYANGRAVVAQIPRIKELTMSCLQHESEAVRDAAIVTLSKVLVDNWRNV